ncbi:MAG: thiamine pyrophosphate-dependent enzyme [Actinobacteria bacterium]|nr:thiamine pyrophosphate-dependent enzyme [Actinomycetota bacterium]
MAKIHGGQVIARGLRNEGVDTIFTLTGGHIIPILDGCHQEGMRIVDFRHEQGAAHAAEAYTRLTGRLGVAVVTAGPGVTDTVTAVATAHQSGVPMLVIGGRHLVRQERKGGLQEMDHTRLFPSITRWAATAWQVDRLADYVATAARHAFAGRGGPVFLDVPMDVQFDMVEETALRLPAHYRAAPAGLDVAAIDQIVKTLQGAERVMIFAGTSGPGPNRLVDLAEMLGAPTFLNSRARGSLPWEHPLLGNYTRSRAMSGAQVLLAFGVDWDFRTGYGERISPEAVVVQIDAEATKVGWNRPAHVGFAADPLAVVAQLLDRADELRRDATPAWTTEIMAAEAEMADQARKEAEDDSVPVMPQRFARDVAEFFGSDSIVAVDGGDIVSTTARWLRVSSPGHVLDPGPFGTLGTGAPYAIAAKVVYGERLVGVVFGDGAFGFNAMEYDTMVRHGLAVVGVVGNDGVWGNIKTFHRMAYPERLVATDLGVRPYHRMVEGLGGYGEMVTEPAEIRPALERAAASGLPALVNVHIAETMRMSSNYSQ